MTEIRCRKCNNIISGKGKTGLCRKCIQEIYMARKRANGKYKKRYFEYLNSGLMCLENGEEERIYNAVRLVRLIVYFFERGKNDRNTHEIFF